MPTTPFYKITHDPEVFVRQIEKLISKCGCALTWRKEKTGIDTSMLRDSQSASSLERAKKSFYDPDWLESSLYGDIEEQDFRLEFDAEIFWNIYRRIADEFERVFRDARISEVPFFCRSGFHKFVENIWASYLELEIWATIDFDQNFAVYIMSAVTYPETYLETLELADDILRRRYHLPD